MQDISPVLIAACGLCTVCGGVLILGVLLIARFTGGGIVGIALPLVLQLFQRGPDVDEDEGSSSPVRTTTARPRSTDIRSRAESLDFDSAVQKYRRQDRNSPDAFTNPPPITPNLPPAAPPPNAEDDAYIPPLRRGRRRDNNLPTIDESEEGGFDDFFDLG